MKETHKIINEMEYFLIEYIKKNTRIGKRGRDEDNSYILHYYEYLDKIKQNISHEVHYSDEIESTNYVKMKWML